jgi:hypothetical protein
VEHLRELPILERREALHDMAVWLSGKLRNCRSGAEASQLVQAFNHMVPGIGLDPRDPEVQKATRPVIEAFGDRRLQNLYQGVAKDYYQYLMKRCEEVVQASPLATGWARISSWIGTNPRLSNLERLALDNLGPFQGFSKRVETGFYEGKPDEFLRDYHQLLNNLERIRSEGQALAHDINRYRGNGKSILTTAAGLPALPFGVGAAAVGAGLSAFTISAGTGSTLSEAAVEGAANAAGVLIGHRLTRECGPFLTHLLGRAGGVFGSEAVGGAAAGLSAAALTTGLNDGRLLTLEEIVLNGGFGALCGGTLGLLFRALPPSMRKPYRVDNGWVLPLRKGYGLWVPRNQLPSGATPTRVLRYRVDTGELLVALEKGEPVYVRAQAPPPPEALGPPGLAPWPAGPGLDEGVRHP